MHEAVRIVSDVNLVIYTGLAVLMIRSWAERRDRPTLWAAVAFGSLAALLLLDRAVPKHPHGALVVPQDTDTAIPTGRASAGALAAQVLATASVLAFLLALSPPALVRAYWRRAEQRRIQAAIAQLMGAPTQAEIVDLILPRIAEFVGARAVTMRDDEGAVIGRYGLDPGTLKGIEAVSVRMTSGELLIWTTPYTPFFGADDLAGARTVGELTLLALDRA